VVVQQVAGTFLGMRNIFARILPNLPKKKLQPKKKFFMFFWEPLCAIFSHIFRDFVKVFQKFCPDFHGFSPNQNFWWFACTPASPPPTPVVQQKI